MKNRRDGRRSSKESEMESASLICSLASCATEKSWNHHIPCYGEVLTPEGGKVRPLGSPWDGVLSMGPIVWSQRHLRWRGNSLGEGS